MQTKSFFLNAVFLFAFMGTPALSLSCIGNDFGEVSVIAPNMKLDICASFAISLSAPKNVKSVIIGSDKIVASVVISSKKIVIFGRAVGTTNLLLLSDDNTLISEVIVNVGPHLANEPATAPNPVNKLVPEDNVLDMSWETEKVLVKQPNISFIVINSGVEEFNYSCSGSCKKLDR